MFFFFSTDVNKKMVNFFLVFGIYKEIFFNNIIMYYFLFYSKFCMILQIVLLELKFFYRKYVNY